MRFVIADSAGTHPAAFVAVKTTRPRIPSGLRLRHAGDRHERITWMEEELQRRVANNEAVFREVNEAIERGHYPGEQDSPAAYRCECASLDCNGLVSLTPREYERVRRRSRRFVLLPGHEIPAVETVVATGDGYVVVEKRDEAGRLAEASDPRS